MYLYTAASKYFKKVLKLIENFTYPSYVKNYSTIGRNMFVKLVKL